MGVYKRPDSLFWWVLLDGYHVRESTRVPIGRTEAQQKEQRRQAEVYYHRRMAALAEQTREPDREVISYVTLSAWYADHHAAHLRGVTRALSMLRQLGLYFDRFRSIAEITPDDIAEWKTWRKRQVGPNTVNRELDVLKSLLKSAVPRYLAQSPALELRRFRVPEAERRVLTPEEEERLVRVGSPDDTAWIILGIDTLMRLSNTVFLKWAQVKLDRRVILPLNAKVSHDVVPMSSRLERALRALPRDSEYVFPQFFNAKKGGQTAAVNRAKRRFAKLCQLAKVDHGRDVEGVTFHCLRHTGATRALQRGASVRTVMKLGGWKDERMVMRYVHASDADVRAAAESIGSLT